MTWWQDILAEIREGKTSIPTADSGIPLAAVNAPFYELMQLMEALTTGHNALVAQATKDQKRIERIRKLAEAHFPAGHKDGSGGWISASHMLPPTSGNYLTYNVDEPHLGVYAYHFSSRHGAFNTTDFQTPERASETAIHVTHWRSFPAPPVKPEKED